MKDIVLPKCELSRMDIQAITQTMLVTPMRHGPVTHITDKDMALIPFGDVNTTALERLFGKMLMQGINGDVPSAKFFMSYTGLEPIPDQHITVDAPVIYNDVPVDEAIVADQVAKPINDVPLE